MNLLYKLYFALPNFSRIGFIGKVINRLLLKLMKFLFDLFVPAGLKKNANKAQNGFNTIPREKKIIVSLTSFPARINDVWVSIETILRQTVKPDAVILWLTESQFPDKKLPQTLMNLQERGLTVKFCDNLRSHTKYYYTLLQHPDDLVVTIDDDCYYPENTIESLLKLHREFPDAICANRAHKITFTQDGAIMPYRKWIHNYKGYRQPHHLLVATGVGGVLYPPNVLAQTVFEKEVFKDICFYADDLWLKVHTDLNNTKVVAAPGFNKDLITVSKTQVENLVSNNSFGGGNDEQFVNVLKHYNFKIKQ